MLSTFSPASAKQTTENTNITFRDITITVDEQPVISDTEPFLYQGRTYIPARALAEYMGGYVEWDDASSTVIVTNVLKTKLRFLGSAAYYAQQGVLLCNEVLDCNNDLIDTRNVTVNPVPNSNEIISNNKSRLNKTINNANSFKNNNSAQSSFEFASFLIDANYEDLQYAISCCENALINIQSAYDCLNQYSKSDLISLENYAVYEDKAYNYYKEAVNIFMDYANSFHNAIWE